MAKVKVHESKKGELAACNAQDVCPLNKDSDNPVPHFTGDTMEDVQEQYEQYLKKEYNSSVSSIKKNSTSKKKNNNTVITSEQEYYRHIVTSRKPQCYHNPFEENDQKNKSQISSFIEKRILDYKKSDGITLDCENPYLYEGANFSGQDKNKKYVIENIGQETVTLKETMISHDDDAHEAVFNIYSHDNNNIKYFKKIKDQK